MTPLYVSVHIPKTAGTTLGSALRCTFGDRLQRAYEDDPGPIVGDPACIHGHDVFTLFADVAEHHPNTKWIVFLRDPLSTAVSLYFHLKKDKGSAKFVDRGLVHWLTHVEEYRWPDPPCYGHNQFQLQWFEQNAKHIGEYDFVGVTEQFDASVLLLWRTFGWELPRYRPENVDGSIRPELDASVIRRFKELNALDYALHAQAIADLERRKRAYGPAFDADLADFRERLSSAGD
jgi:hypothetical protein